MEHSKEYLKLQKLISQFKICMLTTTTADGSLVSRPMNIQRKEKDGDLWFFTYNNSHKARQIETNPQVNLTLGDDEANTWLSLSGTATITEDRTLINELWSPLLKAWFPGGKDTDGIALLKVTLTSAEYWDSPNGLALAVFGSLKAAVTGKPAKSGQNETVDLS